MVQVGDSPIKFNASKKGHFKDFFSTADEVEKWHDRYTTNDIDTFGPKNRLRQTINWLADYQSDSEKKIILDLGCGTGLTTQAIENLDYRVVGLDHAFSMLAKAKVNNYATHHPISFIQGDIETLPFKANTFDFVVCLGVISYLEFCDNALFEIARIVKPQGIIILSFLRRIVILESLISMYRAARHGFRKSRRKSQFDLKRYSLKTIENVFNRNRLAITQMAVVEYSYLSLAWRRYISTTVAIGLNNYLLRRSHRFPFNRIGDMYLIKAEKIGDSANLDYNQGKEYAR